MFVTILFSLPLLFHLYISWFSFVKDNIICTVSILIRLRPWISCNIIWSYMCNLWMCVYGRHICLEPFLIESQTTQFPWAHRRYKIFQGRGSGYFTGNNLDRFGVGCTKSLNYVCHWSRGTICIRILWRKIQTSTKMCIYSRFFWKRISKRFQCKNSKILKMWKGNSRINNISPK